MKKRRLSNAEKVPDPANGAEFDALSAREKERYFQYLEQGGHRRRSAGGTPMKKMGRPVAGAGAKVVAMSVERGLLKRADAYARQRGWKRSELFARLIEKELAR